MLLFTVFLIGLVCVLLIVVVLAQNSKGGGLVTGMGGATQMMGTRRATDWIEKATWVLGTILVVLCLGVNAYVMSGTSSEQDNFEPPIENSSPGNTTPVGGGEGGDTPPPTEDGGTPASDDGDSPTTGDDAGND